MKSMTQQELPADKPDIASRLHGFDTYMDELLQRWHVPGLGVGIVVEDKLVFAKGYGRRAFEKELPFTTETLFQIGSNTKLFTAIAAGMLVETGKLAWDRPIREAVPAIRFYNDELNNTITLRDMLAHRTGIARHDSIWHQRDSFTRKDVFDRIKYFEPVAPLRQRFYYNSVMYAATGYIVELISGLTWEEFVRERILKPLAMHSTVDTVAEMLKNPDFGVPFTEKRDSDEIYRIPYYGDLGPGAPAGAIISNIREMSHWLVALMNNGVYAGKQVIPQPVLDAVMEPAVVQRNFLGEMHGWWELLNPAYGMGCQLAVYRGHLMTYHGGHVDGFHSQVSFLPHEKIGASIFVIGDHCAQLANVVTFNIFEQLLGLSQTSWSDRWLAIRLKEKQASKEARSKVGVLRVPNTNPSHMLADYVGEYKHAVYGTLKIEIQDSALCFGFGRILLPLSHFHYDRFDTLDDERYGKWSVNFLTNSQGDVDKAVISMDEAEATFMRRAEAPNPQLLAQCAGTYETPTGFKFQVVLKEDGFLYLVFQGQPEAMLIPYKHLAFRVRHHSDVTFEFVVEQDHVTALKQRVPAGEYVCVRC